jgi:hypothetical protein
MFNKKSLSLFLVALCGFASIHSSDTTNQNLEQASGPKRKIALTLMTLNVLNEGAYVKTCPYERLNYETRLSNFKAFLQRHHIFSGTTSNATAANVRPDICCFQEMGKDFFDAIKGLSYDSSTNSTRTQNVATIVAPYIAMKYRKTVKPEVCNYSRIERGGNMVHIFNLHSKGTSDSFDHTKEDINNILNFASQNAIPENDPTVICGDFNYRDINQCSSFMKGHGFDYAPNNNFTSATATGCEQTLDYIFFKNMKHDNTFVEKIPAKDLLYHDKAKDHCKSKYFSEHLPLVTTLLLEDKRPTLETKKVVKDYNVPYDWKTRPKLPAGIKNIGQSNS